jgi:hypothetical protein
MSRKPMPQALALFVALTCLAPTSAHAQSRTYGMDLTEANFQGMMRAIKADQEVARQSHALFARADSAQHRSDNLRNQHRADSVTYENQTRANSDCVSKDAVEANNSVKPVPSGFQDRLAAIVRRLEAAKKAGDQPAIDKAMADFTREMDGVQSSKAPATAARKECPMLVEPTWLTEANLSGARADSLREAGKAVDEQRQVPDGGDPKAESRTHYRGLRIGLADWCYEVFAGGSKEEGFDAAERRILESHKEEIRKLYKSGGLRVGAAM